MERSSPVLGYEDHPQFQLIKEETWEQNEAKVNRETLSSLDSSLRSIKTEEEEGEEEEGEEEEFEDDQICELIPSLMTVKQEELDSEDERCKELGASATPVNEEEEADSEDELTPIASVDVPALKVEPLEEDEEEEIFENYDEDYEYEDSKEETVDDYTREEGNAFQKPLQKQHLSEMCLGDVKTNYFQEERAPKSSQKSGERKFVCSTCGKAFLRPCDLSRHSGIHINLRPVKYIVQRNRNKCIVRFCGQQREENISLHKFPERENIRENWKQACSIFTLKKSAVVCSKHFTPLDFFPKRNPNDKYKLKPNAVPSVNLKLMDTKLAPESAVQRQRRYEEKCVQKDNKEGEIINIHKIRSSVENEEVNIRLKSKREEEKQKL